MIQRYDTNMGINTDEKWKNIELTAQLSCFQQ